MRFVYFWFFWKTEIVLSEAEELRQRLGMAEEEILQQRALRKTLYMLMGDLRTPGVRPPKRVAGGFSTYPRPSKRNVAKAGKCNTKAKRERCIAYMESTVVWHFYSSSLFQTCFIGIASFSSILKHPNKSFFNPIKYILTSFTTLYLLFF